MHRLSSNLLLIVFLTAFTADVSVAQTLSDLETRAEKSDFRETARYDEVWAFSDAVAAASENIHKTTFGYTMEGRPLPLLVFGKVASASAADVLRAGKTRVFIQANIHAGEVCGKEAMMLMLRDLAEGKHAEWMDSMVIMIAPIYNADGNERFNLLNRGVQNGPVGGMGQRPNSEDYDLNRDHMKLDSPEARSLVAMINAYDPHVLVDLHTTNGTHHAYHLTYSSPLHPNTPAPIDSFLRDKWLPNVTSSIREKYGWEYYYYGNIPRRGEPGWYTFDHRPRFGNNYAGLRNRMAILSEAYAYLSFKDRVFASKYFVEEILNFAHLNASEIRAIVENADKASVVGEELGLRATFKKSPTMVNILMGDVEEIRNPYSGAMLLNRLDVVTPTQMYEYGSFSATESIKAPDAYVIPPDQEEVIKRLGFHGVKSRTLAADSTAMAGNFRITTTTVAERPFQQHNEISLEGAYEYATTTLPKGSVIVPVNQPLGRLAFSLLEPKSDDGFLNWGMVKLPEGENGVYPISRLGGR